MSEVKVQLSGYYEKKPVWQWDCTCGQKGRMLIDEGSAEREAQEHVIQDHPICGRCMGEIPCGCYSHEARLGLPFPSTRAVILEAYAEQHGKMLGQLLRIKQLARDNDLPGLLAEVLKEDA